MGDDLPDFPVMKVVGFPTCPSDAVEEIKAISKYISDKQGGDGCVRDVIEQVLRLNGKWLNEDSFHW
jgi:3-deoxy-D-manno-octulosonate 8-phosphate phosphatase (KDO 8-P phosphatase)